MTGPAAPLTCAARRPAAGGATSWPLLRPASRAQLARSSAPINRRIAAKRAPAIARRRDAAGLIGARPDGREVRSGTFFDNIGNVHQLYRPLFQLENGQLVWTDPAEWFWGLTRWLRLLGETLLIAYVGTLLGAIGGFRLCFLAAANCRGRSRWLRFAVAALLRILPHGARARLRADLRRSPSGSGPLPGVLARRHPYAWARSASSSPRSSRTST